MSKDKKERSTKDIDLFAQSPGSTAHRLAEARKKQAEALEKITGIKQKE